LAAAEKNTEPQAAATVLARVQRARAQPVAQTTKALVKGGVRIAQEQAVVAKIGLSGGRTSVFAEPR